MLKLETIGYIGKAPEKKVTTTGKEFISFSIAPKKKKDDKPTEWINCIKSGANDGIIPYIGKGALVHVRGDLEVQRYTDREGKQQAALRCFVAELTICTAGEETARPQAAPAATPIPAPQPNALQDMYNSAPKAPAPNPHDDLPF